MLRVLHLARRIITPLVSGVVVMIIGLSLIQVGLTSIGGGYAAIENNTLSCAGNPNAWQMRIAGVITATNIAKRCWQAAKSVCGNGGFSSKAKRRTYVRSREPKWPQPACHKHQDDTFMYPDLFVNFLCIRSQNPLQVGYLLQFCY